MVSPIKYENNTAKYFALNFQGSVSEAHVVYNTKLQCQKQIKDITQRRLISTGLIQQGGVGVEGNKLIKLNTKLC